jgi:hypothetical protein
MTRLSRTLYGSLCVASLLAGIAFGAPAISATHTEYTTSQKIFYNYSERDYKDSWNGHRVYLSSPTHTNSGSRGELGWDENINGRHWNMVAAATDYRNEVWSTSRYRNFRSRGYTVAVSENSKNGQFIQHRTDANNWNADVYVVTHTNATPSDYFLTMVDKQSNTANDRSLRSNMASKLGEAVPSSRDPIESTDASGYTNWSNLGELSSTNQADYVVYNEVIFHDNQNHVNWFGKGSDWKQPTNNAWRYGWAVDSTLEYP